MNKAENMAKIKAALPAGVTPKIKILKAAAPKKAHCWANIIKA